MPFCPIEASELPSTSLAKSPRVVEVKKYQENQPEVYILRGHLAPLDAAVTCMWMKDPRYLQQFLNRRLPLFIFRTRRKRAADTRWEIIFMRQKSSNSLHMIQLQMEVLKKDEHGKWKSFEMMKLHYITDGNIQRFECHDVDASGVPNLDLITTPENIDQLEKMSVVEKGYLLLTVAILEIECGSLSNAFSPEYFVTCDGKWKKPDDLILCPRIDDRVLYPLVDFWELQYYDNECKTLEAMQVENVLDFPLWRRCICQAPASKFSMDSMERVSVEMKMERLFNDGS